MQHFKVCHQWSGWRRYPSTSSWCKETWVSWLLGETCPWIAPPCLFSGQHRYNEVLSGCWYVCNWWCVSCTYHNMCMHDVYNTCVTSHLYILTAYWTNNEGQAVYIYIYSGPISNQVHIHDIVLKITWKSHKSIIMHQMLIITSDFHFKHHRRIIIDLKSSLI